MSQRLNPPELNTDLNLRELREGSWFGVPLSAPETTNAPAFALSRRAFLTFGGGALVSLSAPLALANAATKSASANSDFTLTHDAESAVFSIDNASRWTIDIRRFSGNPKLRVQTPTAKIPTYRISLKNARFPATDLPADFKCEIRQIENVWTLKLEMALGGFQCETPFAAWLQNQSSARAKVDFSTDYHFCDLSNDARLRLMGKGEMTFSPSWLIQIEGEKIAALSGKNNETHALFSDAISLRLAQNAEPSLMQSASRQRTFVLLQKGAHAWQMQTLFNDSHDNARGWNLVAQGEPFDQICIEGGENASGENASGENASGENASRENTEGKRRFALLATGDETKNDGDLRFAPSGFHDGNGQNAHLILTSARLAISFKEDGHHTALLARFGEASWIHNDDCALQVGNDSQNKTAPFQLLSDGESVDLHCAPSLLAASLSLPDAVCEPVFFADAPPLHFDYESAGFRDIEYSNFDGSSGFHNVDTRVLQLPNLKLPFPLPLPRPRRRPTPEPTPTPEETPSDEDEEARNERQMREREARAANENQTPEPTPQDDTNNARTDEETPTVLAPRSDKTIEAAPTENTTVIKSREGASTSRTRTPRKIGDLDIGRVTIDKDKLGVLFPTNLSISVVRPEDLLVLRFDFLNLSLQTGGASQLKRGESGKAAYIVVTFPPQNIAEQAFLEPPDALPNGMKPPVESRIAGPSRLVFRVPNDVSSIPYTLKDLLRVCGEFPLSVASTAQMPKLKTADFVVLKNSGIQDQLKGQVFDKKIILAPGKFSQLSIFTRSHAQQRDTPTRRKPSLSDVLKQIPNIFKKPDKNPQVFQPSDNNIILVPGLILNSAPYAPRLFETAIESPYRLIISPNEQAGWAHLPELQMRDAGKAAGQRAELWHTRLGVRSGKLVDEQTSSTRTLRAIWSNDYNADFGTGSNWPQRSDISDDSSYRPFRMSLEAWERHQLVAYTSDFTKPKADERFIETERLMLSSLGAWMRVKASFTNLPLRAFPGFDLEAWTHQSTMGRDHYVRVVKKGFLFPFGHRASKITVTERKFVPQPGTATATSPGYMMAILRQRVFIVVREKDKSFPAAGQRFGGRTMPFKNVRITTTVTPNIDVTSAKAKVVGVPNSSDAIWPVSGGVRFPFHLVGTDEKGNNSDFTAPLIFVTAADDFAYEKANMDAVNAAYIASPADAIRPFQGQNIAYAPDTAQNPGTTTYETQSVFFAADTTSTIPDATHVVADQPHFYPAFAIIEARIPPVQQLLGNTKPAVVALSPAFVNDAFDGVKNKGEVLFEMLQKNDFGMKFPPDKSGGLATPNININALSRKFGPVGGDIAKFAAGKFDPQEYFAGMEAKILGGIDLFKIIGVPTGFDMGDGKNVPKLVTKLQRDGNGIPTGNRTELSWNPDVKEFLIFQPTSSTQLLITAVLEAKFDNPAPPAMNVTGSMTSFQINFFEFIKLNFDLLKFVAQSGKKLDVTADMQPGNEVEFGGPLKFVNTIKKYIPSDGFSDPPSLDISPAGITAGYSLGLPTIAIGVFSLSNVSLGAALTLPFTGAPVRFRFNFCERENPFTLVVSLFGGGGFFAIAVGLDGVEILEASLEFGGAIAFDIGVASGGVHVMAGVYFKWENDACELTGYLRLGGSVEVLGLITISVEFYMGLTYATGGKVTGEATLTVEVEVLFFSTSVSMSVRREFGGSSDASAYLPESHNGVRLASLPEGELPSRLQHSDTNGSLFAQGPKKKPKFGASSTRSGSRSVGGSRPVNVRDILSEADWKEYCGAFA